MGFLFGKAPTPVIAAPIKEVEKPKTTELDPDHGAAIAEAKRKRIALAARSSRSNLRTQLATPGADVRQGSTIRQKQ